MAAPSYSLQLRSLRGHMDISYFDSDGVLIRKDNVLGTTSGAGLLLAPATPLETPANAVKIEFAKANTFRFVTISSSSFAQFPSEVTSVTFTNVNTSGTQLPLLPETVTELVLAEGSGGKKDPNLSPGLRRFTTGSKSTNTDMTIPEGLEYLDISNSSFKNTGIKIVKGLVTDVDVFPVLPTTLRTLICKNVKLTLPPTLPYTLETVDLSNSSGFQTAGNFAIPENVRYLNLSGNTDIKDIPLMGDATELETLILSRTKITSLPTDIQPSCVSIDVSETSLTSTENLPTGILDFNCSNCRALTIIDNLPSSLVDLNFTGCTSLITLNISGTSMKAILLDENITGLSYIDASNTGLTVNDIQVMKVPKGAKWIFS